MTFRDYLVYYEACPEAKAWVGKKTLFWAWNNCERPDWMIWASCRFCRSPGWSGPFDVMACVVDLAAACVERLPVELRDVGAGIVDWAQRCLQDQRFHTTSIHEALNPDAEDVVERAFWALHRAVSLYFVREAQRSNGMASDVNTPLVGGYFEYVVNQLMLSGLDAKFCGVIRRRLKIGELSPVGELQLL